MHKLSLCVVLAGMLHLFPLDSRLQLVSDAHLHNRLVCNVGNMITEIIIVVVAVILVVDDVVVVVVDFVVAVDDVVTAHPIAALHVSRCSTSVGKCNDIIVKTTVVQGKSTCGKWILVCRILMFLGPWTMDHGL